MSCGGARAAVVLSSVLFFQLSRIFGDYLLVVPGWLFQGGAEPILVPWNTLNELIKCSCSVLGPEALQLLSSLRDVLKETRIIRFDRIKTILVTWNTLTELLQFRSKKKTIQLHMFGDQDMYIQCKF